MLFAMNINTFFFTVILCVASVGLSADPLVLTGETLTVDDVVQVARFMRPVEISPTAHDRVGRAHRLLLSGAKYNLPIYGLNRGVGLNKDRKVFQGATIDPEVMQLSEQFNKNLIYSHSTGIGSDMPEALVRASMLVRLNTLLRGVAGIQPYAPELLEAFLNLHIHPVMPCRGSVGEADIAILSHIALAMIGEGEVTVAGVRMPADQALKAYGLKPLIPYGKDALSILSSNAYSVAFATLTLHDVGRLIDQMNVVFAMSLEGFNGNVAPFLFQAQKVRPFCSQWNVAKNVCTSLEGSFLWQVDENRPLQDPLSFRTATQVHAATVDLLELLHKQMLINLNSSDDNPAVILDIVPSDATTPQERQYYINDEGVTGAIIPSANFEPIIWVVKFESLAIALTHVAHNSVQRMIHLGNPEFTGLSRFLSSDERYISFGTIQKAFIELDTEIRSLANPVSVDSFPVAGTIEDHATNAPFVVRRVAKIVDNLMYIVAMEEMHAAQALDLRLSKHAGLTLGKATQAELIQFRQVVPFLKEDRVLGLDIQNAYVYTKNKVRAF